MSPKKELLLTTSSKNPEGFQVQTNDKDFLASSWMLDTPHPCLSGFILDVRHPHTPAFLLLTPFSWKRGPFL